MACGTTNATKEEIRIAPKPDGQTFECDADSFGKVSWITNQKSLHMKKS